MNRFSVTTFAAVLLLVPAISSGEVVLENLTNLPGVTYTYIADDGKDLGPNAFNDKTGHSLNDGSTANESAATTIYQSGSAKRIAVRFAFPTPIAPRQVQVDWMWPFNANQCIDRIVVYVGNEPDALKSVGQVDNPERTGGNSTKITIPLKPARGRYVVVTAEQDAKPEHFMMGIGEVAILAPAQEVRRIQAAVKPSITIDVPRHAPCNLFDVNEPVSLNALVKSDLAGPGKLHMRVTNYFHEVLDEQTLPFDAQAGKAVKVPLPLDITEPGYYEMDLTAEVTTPQAKTTISASRQVCLAVAPLSHRTATEAIAAGSRFGVGWCIMSSEGKQAMTRLGIQWDRGLFCWAPGAAPTAETRNWGQVDSWISILNEDTINCVLEIKSIPTHAFDKKRYEGKDVRDWTLGTVPLAEPWKAFVREQVAHVPAEMLDRVYFEIWNEPHGKMSAGEFAELAQMTLEAIRSVHPNARIGANIDPMGYLDIVLQAGGMKGMDFLAVHPYSADFMGSPEQHDLRTRIRSYKELLKKRLGRELPILVTEIGWPTPPEGPCRNTEERQAQCNTRAAIAMVAEDVKVITPYRLKQGEENPADREAYFGFFRVNEEPKPALVTYATAARMIDCSQFVGDLWFGKDVSALLFERDGVYTLVLSSDDMTRHILVRPGVEELKIVDTVGRSRTVKPHNGKLSITVTSDPIYLVGVSKELAKDVRSIASEKLWTHMYRRSTRVCKHMDTPPKIDGVLDEYKNLPAIRIREDRISPDDASADVRIAWDEKFFYLACDITDNELKENKYIPKEVWKGDSIGFNLGTDLKRTIPGFMCEYDYQILIAPSSENGQPVCLYGDSLRQGQPLKDVRMAFGKTAHGWTAEIAIPLENFLNFPAEKRKRIAFEVGFNDEDSDHGRNELTSNGRGDNWCNPSVWSYLVLE